MADLPRAQAYVALLRGVNVGGNTLSTEQLRGICAELGLENARTYVQSGNLVFDAAGSAERWSKSLEQALAGKARLPITVLVRSRAEMAALVERNPFAGETGIDLSRLHVTFLRQAPKRAALTALNAIDAGPDRLSHAGREIYLHCPNGYGRTKLSNTMIEKTLSVAATTRNWRTSNTLLEMASRPTTEKN